MALRNWSTFSCYSMLCTISIIWVKNNWTLSLYCNMLVSTFIYILVLLNVKWWLKYYYKFIICDIPQWVANILKMLQPSIEYRQISLLLAFLTKRFYLYGVSKCLLVPRLCLQEISILVRDQYQYLGNSPPTSPLTQQQSIDNNLGLMLGWGRGRWAVAQILILMPGKLQGFGSTGRGWDSEL